MGKNNPQRGQRTQGPEPIDGAQSNKMLNEKEPHRHQQHPGCASDRIGQPTPTQQGDADQMKIQQANT